MTKQYTIALAGNPNTGKSTIFNALTGSRQHVGNWPGKTVEKKEGSWKYEDTVFEVVDLPGTYSLTAYSLEEVIARDFVINEKPDLVVTVLDAANLERNLYLALQIIEMGVQVVVALNMSDAAESRGFKIDIPRLSKSLNVPIIPTIASKGIGLEQLKQAIAELASKKEQTITFQSMTSFNNQTLVNYGTEIENEIAKLQSLIEQNPILADRYFPRWLAIKLLEQDADTIEKVSACENTTNLLSEAEISARRITEASSDDAASIIADRRYTWINNLMHETVQRSSRENLNLSDRIDKIVTNRIFGIPIFLAMMWVVFKITTDVAAPYLDWVDGVIGGPITNWVIAILDMLALGGTWVESLFLDGIIAGVGGVLVFVPVLMSLYLALAILEDSGYMARAAFVMDRLMHAVGLHGKSFLPMIVGFGCTVPAIYATRTLENEKDRILTALLVPFMSCGARLPVYALFASIFFPDNTGTVIFSMYLLGILVAILVGMVLKNTLFKDKQESPFVMELPPYRMPTLQNIWLHMWERTGAFVRKAWTIILATSVVLWFLLAIPLGGNASFANADVENSLFAGVAKVFAPAFRPLGFGEWQASGSLMTGFVAKEVVISSMAQVYGVEGESEETQSSTFFQDLGEIANSFLSATLDMIKSIPSIIGINLLEGEEEPEPTDLMISIKSAFQASSGGHGALAALSFMVFTLLYTPCMVAVAAMKQELGTKWMWYSVLGQLFLAWMISLIVFQGGVLLGLG